jgi:hypothetical protein
VSVKTWPRHASFLYLYSGLALSWSLVISTVTVSPLPGDLQVGPGDADLTVADAQEAADVRHHAVDLAVLGEIDRLDLADRLAFGVLDVAADQLAGVGGGRRTIALLAGAVADAGGLVACCGCA